MKFRSLNLTVILFLSFGLFVQAQNADDILKKHFEVIGQDKVLKLQSASLSGKVIQAGQEFTFNMYQKRPNNFRMDINIQGQKIIQGFDGETGWFVNPMMGSTEPQELPPDQLKQMKKQSDMDGLLWDYKSKGSTLEFTGTDDLEGTEVYKLKLTDKDQDVTTYFIDKESYILLKTASKTLVQGVEVESAQSYGNYQLIEGMAVPFSITTLSNGQVMVEIAIDNVEYNPDFEEGFFKKPGK